LSLASRLRGAELAALLAVYAALALGFERAVPFFEAPDEPSHLHYAAVVAWEGRLPRTRPQLDVPGEGMQPPLYYLWLAPWLRALAAPDGALIGELHDVNLSAYRLPGGKPYADTPRIVEEARGSAYYRVAPEVERLRALRFATLPIGLLAVALSFAAVRGASGSRALALLSASLLAFTPQYAFVSSYLNNDVASVALGAAALWLFVRAASRAAPARRDYLAAAGLAVVGAATKLSALPMLAVTCAALPLLDARPFAARARDAGAAAALALVGLAALAGLNVARFGEPTGMSAVWESSAELVTPEKFGGFGSYLANEYVRWTFESYWARFGWMHVGAPFGVYLACFTLLWTGLLGAALAAWRGEAQASDGRCPPVSARRLRRYLAAVLLATFASHVWLNVEVVAAQGRHLFAAAPALACALASGLAWLATGRSTRIGWVPALALSAAMLSLSLYCLVAVLGPAYST
jgi:hypothetical protein